jgi:transcriptional regulator of aromatic amino acid metabolism
MFHGRNAPMRTALPAQRAGICGLYQSGESGHALAKRFGVSKTTIHRTLACRGISKR